jgi:hypothetical protein
VTIKFKGWDMMLLTKFSVESGRGLHPLPLEIEFYKTVTDKKVTSHEIDQLLCGEVVADIRQTHT